jgi:hypothetical protein
VSDLAVIPDSQIERIAKPWWQIWAALHWGFRKPACVLWCAAGRISAVEAESVLGIDTFHPIDLVLFYREMVKELTPERELASLIVDQMPLAERKHLKRFYAGRQVFEAGDGRRTIAHLVNEVFRPAYLPRLRESDDSDDSRVADLRNFTEGLRRTNLMRSEDPPIAQSKTPLIFISARCPELRKTLPSLQYDEKKPEDTKIIGNEQDSIWEAAKTCFREYPNATGMLPGHVRRQQFIDKGVTPMQRYLNAIEFDHKNRPQRITKRR